MISVRQLNEEYKKTLLRFVISVGDRMETLIYDTTAHDKDKQILDCNNSISRENARLKELIANKQAALKGNTDSISNFYGIKAINQDIYRLNLAIEDCKKRLEYIHKHLPLAQKYVDFCKSFNYAGSEIRYKIELTQERKDFFAKESEFGDVGNLVIGALGVEPWQALRQYIGIIFEDIEVYYNDRKITESISHEDYFAVEFDDELETKFLDFENQRERNVAILKDLKRCACPQDLVGKKTKVTLDDSALIFDVQDGHKVIFDFTGYKHQIGNIGCKKKEDMDFVSGNEYVLEEIDLDHDVQGTFEPSALDYYHSDLYISLITDSGARCCITIEADKIFVDID